jgi:hypothetical protein
MANTSYELATTLFIGFLPYMSHHNQKLLYCSMLFIYEHKQFVSEQKASVLNRTYIHEYQKTGSLLLQHMNLQSMLRCFDML